jgi:undecaprenyl-diphosphatase
MLSWRKPIFVASAAAFALLSAAAGARWLYPVDVWALHVAQHRTSETLDAAGEVFSVPGDLEYATTALVVLSAVLFLGGRRVVAGRLLTAFVITGLVEFAMKMLLPQVPMPEESARSTDPSPIFEVAYPYPYPSGHMLRSVILLGAVYVLWPNKFARVAVLVFLAGMAASRVYLGVHWASDVLGGALLGVTGVAWAFKAGQHFSTPLGEAERLVSTPASQASQQEGRRGSLLRALDGASAGKPSRKAPAA